MGQGQRQAALAADMRDARARIEKWRRTREKRTAMPGELWEGATGLARVHGVHRTAQALRLSYDSLKRRVEGAGSDRAGGGDHPGFIEMSPAQLMGLGQPTGPVVELWDKDGARLVIRLSESEQVNAADLAEAFWSRRR